jgi:hypothetical protein
MALGLGTAGIRSVPNEERLAQAVRGVITEPGLYFFPGRDPSRKMTPEEERAWTERYRRGPSGMISRQPGGRDPMEPTQFVIELLADILAAGVAAFLLTRLQGPFLARAGAVGLLGVFEWARPQRLVLELGQVPGDVHGRALLDQVIGWTLAGLVMACGAASAAPCRVIRGRSTCSVAGQDSPSGVRGFP